MKRPFLRSFHLKNFKAVRDSKAVRLTPLTVFIGNNGSGKSSIIEGLETYQKTITDGLDSAMNQWRGFEHIRNQAVPHNLKTLENSGKEGVDRTYATNPIEFKASWDGYQATMAISSGSNIDEIFIQEESLTSRGKILAKRFSDGEVYIAPEGNVVDTQKNNLQWSKRLRRNPSSLSRKNLLIEKKELELVEEKELVEKKDNGSRSEVILFKGELPEDSSILNPSFKYELGVNLADRISDWQFVNLNPSSMGSLTARKRTGGKIKLNKDGSNIAEYLSSIRDLSIPAFQGIVEALQYVLSYAADLQPAITSELERNFYLQLTESDFKLPGWLFSTGTLRILALLALLRHPEPPPLIVIEEIENGLDPQTIHLIVEEIRSAVESGNTQILLTSHSPYLLDLLELEHIVLVERDESGQPVFSRPADQDSLQEWSKRFGPGRLYTENRLGKGRG